MSPIPLAQYAIMLHSVPHLGPQGISRLFAEPQTACPKSEVDLGALHAWKLSADSLQREYKLHPEAARCITSCREQLMSASSEIYASASRLGIRVLTLLDPDYPCALREWEQFPPPIVYAYGNLSLLRERKFAAIASNGISQGGMDVLRDISGVLADNGLAVVTSHNTCPYQIAGLAAKSRNAPVLLVLDRGILSAFPRGLAWEPIAQARIWNLQFDPERDLVVSPFRLYDPWVGANGRRRDRMVFGLADVVVAVEIRAGGVMESECLRAYRQGREVYVHKPDSGDMPGGNATLLDKGCEPIPARWANSLLATLDVLDQPGLDTEVS